MLTTLVNSLDSRMSKYENRDIYILARTLDPRFKLKWCGNKDEKKYAKAILFDQAKAISQKSNTHVHGSDTEILLECETETPPSKKRKIQAAY